MERKQPAEFFKPWDRQPGEPSKAFAAFVIYRDLGAKRSIDMASRTIGTKQTARGRAPRHYYTWSSDWNWLERCRLWDNHLGGMMQEIRESAVKDAAERLEEKRRTHANNEVGLAALLGERLMEMLQRPVYRRIKITDPNTGVVTEQSALSEEWSYAHVAMLLRTFSDVCRRGLAMNNDQDEENDPTRFAEIFFRTKGEMSNRVPAGVMPEMPVDPSAKPVLNLSPKQLAEAGVGDGNGNGHTNGRPKKVRPE